ncbi:MAG: membrane protein insertion efficiency factor YidD [Planctomycetes bacterium]|nr:membrane protein insertion efficiency factor YidD [Planctomycetota bacterium]
MRRLLDRALAWILLAGIALYRAVLSPLLGGACRFTPSCSEYGAQALRRHGGLRGLRLTTARILRCRPGVPGGEDPVPPA